jgi:hypothetical protein
MTKTSMVQRLILSVIVILTCLSSDMIWGSNISDAEKCVNKIIAESSRTLSKRHKMRCVGTSASMPWNTVRGVGLRFQIVGPLTQDQLRPILIDCTNEMVRLVNANTEIRPYLASYPFTPNNIDLVIFVKNAEGYPILPPEIGIADSLWGSLSYAACDTSAKPVIHQKLATESFETAEGIVKADSK